MADKQPEEKDGFVELIKKLWSPVAGILGAVTSVFNFYQLWSGNQATIIYIFAGGGFLLLFTALAWIGFSKKDIPKRGNRKATKSVFRYSINYRRIAWSGLAILTLLAIFGVYFFVQHRTEQENKLIVLIAEFEGPEDVHGLRNRIVESLNTDFSEDENIEIKLVDEVIRLSKGSEYARRIGKNHQADIVIWGWYREENPNISIHVENLSSNQLLTLQDSENFQTATTLSEKDFSTFIQQSGGETSALISFLAGIIEYESENYEIAIQYFDSSLLRLPTSPLLFENQVEIYFYRGNSYAFSKEYERAIKDYDLTIQINPLQADAYNNRGNVYNDLGEYEYAIQDFDQAIQINPQDASFYNNRGNAQIFLGKYEYAIQDYEQAIRINPQYDIAYNNRGNAYADLGDYESAIQDFNQAIQINPQISNFHNNRGTVYADLEDYESAIQDFNQAIQINPQLEGGYYNRGLAYYYLEDYERAIQDYSQAIQINPQLDVAYYNRGLAYQALGKTAEAEADFAKYKELTGEDAP